MTSDPTRRESLSRKVLRNTLYNIAGRFWALLVGLFLTPYIIHRIGVERFGIWAIVGIITGYFGLLDLGVGMSFVKYIAQYYTKKDYESINRVINTGCVFYLALAIAASAAAILFTGPIVSLLKIPPELHDEAVFVLIIGVVLFAAANAVSVFHAVQSALQRMDISNKVSIAVSIANVGGTVFFLEKGYGLKGLVINNVIVFAIATMINITVASKILPELRFRLSYISREMMRRLFSFGFRMQIAKISGITTMQIDKVLIAYFLSIGMVTYFQLGSSVVYYAASLAGLLVSALMPAFTEIEARGERGVLIDAYLRSSKYLTFVIAPLFVFIAVAAPYIMAAWMGQDYGKSAMVIRILAAGWAVNTVAQVSASVCMAIDRPQFMARGSIVIIVLSLVLSVILIKLYGFYGAAWGTTTALLIGTCYFIMILQKVLAVALKKLISSMLPSVAASLLAAIFLFGALGPISRVISPTGRLAALSALAIQGAIFSAVYFTAAYFFRVFDNEDIALFKKRFAVIRRIMR